MKRFTKIISVVLAAVMLLSAFCITASAASDYENAKLVDSGKKLSFTLEAKKLNSSGRTSGNGIPRIYKIELSKKGTLKLDVVTAVSSMYIQVLDEEGAEIFLADEIDVTTGYARNLSDKSGIWVEWKSSVNKAKNTLKFNLDKGTYYVKIYVGSNAIIDGKTSISFTYPQAEKAKSAEITSFAITLEEGDTLQLDAILSGEGDVTWSSSKKSVASVSDKGKVTAKKKGTAVITAKTGSSSMKITIKVK